MQSVHPFFSDRKRCHRCKTLTHLKGEGCTYLCPLGFLKTAPAVAWNQINGRSVIRAHHRALVEPGQSPSKPNRKRHGTTAGSQSHRRTPTVQPNTSSDSVGHAPAGGPAAQGATAAAGKAGGRCGIYARTTATAPPRARFLPSGSTVWWTRVDTSGHGLAS
jgi:hypothetical protein